MGLAVAAPVDSAVQFAIPAGAPLKDVDLAAPAANADEVAAPLGRHHPERPLTSEYFIRASKRPYRCENLSRVLQVAHLYPHDSPLMVTGPASRRSTRQPLVTNTWLAK
jgi:hypothetical protein